MPALHTPFQSRQQRSNHRIRWVVLIAAALAAVVWRPRTVLSTVQRRVGGTVGTMFGGQQSAPNRDQPHASASAPTTTPNQPEPTSLGATIAAGEDTNGVYRPERVEPDVFGVVVTDASPAGLSRATGWVKGDGSDTCPEGYPIKGNGSSRIYHLPGEATYAQTIAAICFADEESAAAAGFQAIAR